MRIVYLHQYFNTPQMSGSTRSWEMARRLVAAGHEVHLLTSLREPDPGAAPAWRLTEEAGIRVHWLPVPYSNRMGYRRRMRAFFAFATHAAGRAAALRPDLVFATSTPLTIALPAVWAARRNRAPLVFEVRDLWPEIPIAVGALRHPLLVALARRLERFAYRHSAHVVALSPGMAEGVACAGYPAPRITVIPNSADLDLFRVPPQRGQQFLARLPHLQGGPLVLYAGTLGAVNGVDYLAEIAAETAQLDPTVRFLIVGEGREELRVRETARRLGVLERNLWMLPPLPKAQMPDLLSACALSCSLVVDLPALWANSANKFFDSLAAGRPVLINHQGWQADLLREHGAGIVVPPRDPPAAARLLADTLRHRPRLAQMGRRAACLAEQRFDRERLAAELLALLERVARDRPAPPRLGRRGPCSTPGGRPS